MLTFIGMIIAVLKHDAGSTKEKKRLVTLLQLDAILVFVVYLLHLIN